MKLAVRIIAAFAAISQTFDAVAILGLLAFSIWLLARGDYATGLLAVIAHSVYCIEVRMGMAGAKAAVIKFPGRPPAPDWRRWLGTP